MIELLIKTFFLIAKNGTKFGVQSKDGMIRTYYDRNGQRECYLAHYWEGSKLEPTSPNFTVRRHLSFTNKEDEGKQGAILFALDLSKLNEKTHIVLAKNRIEIDNLVFSFRDNVL